MEVILGMTLEPPLHTRRLVRPVIVQDQVDLHTRLPGEPRVDLVEELEELLLPVASSVQASLGGAEKEEPTLADSFSVWYVPFWR